ncbi:prfA [Symbiodinium sp. CCMP2592]|nr:prfA [Symbiodinium sp. CCMP2592]
MPPAELAQHMHAGRAVAEDEIRRRGALAPGPGALAPVGDAPPAGGENHDQGIWVPGKKIGEEVSVPIDAPWMGDRALVRVTDSEGNSLVVMEAKIDRSGLAEFCEGRIALCRGSEAIAGEDKQAGDDVRTMSVRYLANGERGRNFKDSVKEFVQVEFDDWPLLPRTCQDYLSAVSEVAESCYMQHLAWVQQARIPEGDRAIYEDELLSRVIDMAVKYDCLNIVNLASFEMIIRRKQLLAEAHVGNPASPSYEAADYFMGRRYRPGGGIVVQSLTEHVAKRMHEDAQIQKEKRKLSEAKGNGKNKGKVPTSPPNPEGGGGGKK